MSAHFLDVLQGLSTLKIFGRSGEQAATIGAISRRHGALTMEVLCTAFQTSLVLEWGAAAATALVAIAASLHLMAGAMPFQEAVFVLLLTPEFFLPLRQLALHYHAGAAASEALSRIFAIADTPSPCRLAISTARIPLHRAPDIDFEAVDFAYDSGGRPALDGFSLRLPAGRVMALVGPSGAGKTTVAGLLLRFVEPERGAIYIDGQPLGNLNPDLWLSQVAWAPQHPYLLNGTIADNLRLARTGANPDELAEALAAVDAYDFVRRLPQGLETPVGERGTRLSGGQVQRIALARALLKDAPLLIIDEATSHLEPRQESAVWQTLARQRDRRTVIVITHNRDFAREADVVAYMERGRILGI
jgi:ATP-binding cassette subfamily C protein CydD